MLLVWLSVTGKLLFWYFKQVRWNRAQWEPGYWSVLISWHETVDSQMQSATKNKLILILILCITQNHSIYGLLWYQKFAIYTRKYSTCIVQRHHMLIDTMINSRLSSPFVSPWQGPTDSHYQYVCRLPRLPALPSPRRLAGYTAGRQALDCPSNT